MTKRFTGEQIDGILREAETGKKPIAELAQAHRISEPTFYVWRWKRSRTIEENKTVMKISKAIAILLTFLFTGLTSGLHAQENKTTKLDHLFVALSQSGQFSGNVMIAENGKALYQKSFGLSDQEKQLPLNEDTLFLLASVSKQFTAIGVVLLKVAGKLRYEDELVKYLPELPYPGVTIRQMLNHTSGLPDYGPLMQEHWDKTKYATNEDMIKMLLQYRPPAFFSPGQKYLYSNTGYAMLATIIERVSGMSFADYMESQVFKPLDMTRTIIHTRRARPRSVPNYAIGYVYEESLQRFVLPDAHPTLKLTVWEDGIYGEDGVNSTTGDLLKWDQAVYRGAFIPAVDLAAILTPGKPAEGASDYGFGWHITNPKGKGRIAFHSGGWPGYIAYNEQYLDKNRTIIILRNKFAPQTRNPIDAIREILDEP
jgi:CubicO group peptidase (beta-lactamase class C family)